MNSDTTGNEKIISELKEMEKDIEEIRKVMENISKKGDCISLLKIHSQYIALTLGYTQVLTIVLEDMVSSNINLTNAIKNLPNRKEFEETKMNVSKIQEKAEKSITIMNKAFKETKENLKRGEEVYG